MASNRCFFLKRVILVQQITLQYKDRGATQKWIYENVIRDQFFISKSTYDNYLAINAKREIKELNTNNDEN